MKIIDAQQRVNRISAPMLLPERIIEIHGRIQTVRYTGRHGNIQDGRGSHENYMTAATMIHATDPSTEWEW